MIRVLPQPEPPNFDQDVRSRGFSFLSLNSAPTAKQFSQHSYWKGILPDLLAAYSAVCAYSAMWVSRKDSSVDHFVPKSRNRQLAYEWANYRLSEKQINSIKGDKIGLLDPFQVQNGWFHLDFASGHIRPADGLEIVIEQDVQATIAILDLNAGWLVGLRFSTVRKYAKGEIDFGVLEEKYPFLASELQRQGVRLSIIGAIP